MIELVCPLLAVAFAVMRNGSTADLDAAVYTVLFWVWVLAAVGVLIA